MKILKAKMLVEIWSDIACPFCYMGKRKFEKALESFQYRNDLEIVWKSFQLNLGLQTDPSINIYDYMDKVKGFEPDEAREMNEELTAEGRKYGIDFQFDRIVVANTQQAHQLIQLAKKSGRQNEAEDVLFKAYFSEGKNVDDQTILTEAGKEIGLEEPALSEIFDGYDYSNEVEKDMYEAVQLGIHSVPFFVFNQKYAVKGAHDPEVFLKTLERSFQEWKGKF